MELKQSCFHIIINHSGRYSIGLCSKKLVIDYCCCDIFHQHHSTLTKFFNFNELVVRYPKLITKRKNILIELTFTISNHELPFMVTFSTSYCDNNDNNSTSGKFGLQLRGFKFFEKIKMEKLWNQSKFK